jgi:outer membrane lipoprotein-sorting protein
MRYQEKKVIFLIFLALMSFSALGQDAGSLPPNKWAQSFENYLFNLGSVSGKFTQLDKFGKVLRGNFWSNGKGSIKFSYMPQSELIIVIKDGLISVREIDEGPVSQYSIKDSPISSLFSKDFSLEKFLINEIVIKGSIGTIELRTKKNSSRNSVFLTGDYPNPQLRQWKLIDTQNNETIVFFSKIEKFNFLDEGFFNIN